MFDTMSIAKRIKQARIDKNMTQLQLADAMGVSYQAVSNWERGNSMPDIARVGDLCNALGLTVNELLGMEEKTAVAVAKAMEQENLTAEELQEVALMLPPEQLRECLQDSKSGCSEKQTCKIDISAVLQLAPFLDQGYLSNLVEQAEVTDLSQVIALAPFLNQSALDAVVSRCQDGGDFGAIISLAPFLSQGTLGRLIRCRDIKLDWNELCALAPFADQCALDELVEKILEEDGVNRLEYIGALAPFLSQRTLQKIIQLSAEA